MKVGYQGVFGAYSSEAAIKHFCGDKAINNISQPNINNEFIQIDDFTFYNFAKFEDVFKAVDSGQIDRGVIPLENSYAGRVAEIHNLFPLYNLYIVDEHVLPVKHNLLGVSGSKIDDISTIYSHEQAIMQCSQNISKYFSSGIELKQVANTAVAAELVAKNKNKNEAAIASSFAAKFYNLDTIMEGFNDSKSNYTTFVIISKEPVFANIDDDFVITSLIFTVRNIPAAIYKSIGGFATNNVDLIKLESYIPGGISSSSAQFFLSFRGHISQPNVRLAMEELGFFATKSKLIGCYKGDRLRIANTNNL